MQYIAIIDVTQLIVQTKPAVLQLFEENNIGRQYLTSWYRWALNHILHKQFNLGITNYEDVYAWHNVYIPIERLFAGQFLSCVSAGELRRLHPDLTYQTVFTGQELLLVSCKDV